MSRDEVAGRVTLSLALFVIAMGCVMWPEGVAWLAGGAAGFNLGVLLWRWFAECMGWTRSPG